MTEAVLVSVIVPCYNQALYLPETLDSVLSQTYPCWECIIVNDGSTDNTEQVALDYCNKDTRFHYVSQSNSGLATARNIGILNSQGEFLLPLDSDDKIGTTYIEKAVHYFQENPQTKLVYCRAELFGVENGLWDLPPYRYEDFIWKNSIFCSAIYRRRDYDKTTGYNANMHCGYEDWDFYLSLLSQDDVVHQIDEVLFQYRTKTQSMVMELVSEKRSSMLTQIYKNHPNIYSSYIDQIIVYQRDILELKSEIEDLELECGKLRQVRESKAYWIGKIILRPFSSIKDRLIK